MRIRYYCNLLSHLFVNSAAVWLAQRGSQSQHSEVENWTKMLPAANCIASSLPAATASSSMSRLLSHSSCLPAFVLPRTVSATVSSTTAATAGGGGGQRQSRRMHCWPRHTLLPSAALSVFSSSAASRCALPARTPSTTLTPPRSRCREHVHVQDAPQQLPAAYPSVRSYHTSQIASALSMPIAAATNTLTNGIMSQDDYFRSVSPGRAQCWRV